MQPVYYKTRGEVSKVLTMTTCKSHVELTMATLEDVVIPTIIELLFPLL